MQLFLFSESQLSTCFVQYFLKSSFLLGFHLLLQILLSLFLFFLPSNNFSCFVQLFVLPWPSIRQLNQIFNLSFLPFGLDIAEVLHVILTLHRVNIHIFVFILIFNFLRLLQRIVVSFFQLFQSPIDLILLLNIHQIILFILVVLLIILVLLIIHIVVNFQIIGDVVILLRCLIFGLFFAFAFWWACFWFMYDNLRLAVVVFFLLQSQLWYVKCLCPWNVCVQLCIMLVFEVESHVQGDST